MMFNARDGKFHFNGIGNIALSAEDLIKQSAFHYKDKLSILSDSWQMVFTPSNKYLANSASWQPWLILVLGTAITAVIAIFLFCLL